MKEEGSRMKAGKVKGELLSVHPSSLILHPY
jgi:hypothetical protein